MVTNMINDQITTYSHESQRFSRGGFSNISHPFREEVRYLIDEDIATGIGAESPGKVNTICFCV
jgi:hypothetical protein